MSYILGLVMLGFGYHTFTYGLSLWKDDKNKLGSISTIAIAIIGTLVPLYVLISKSG